MRTANLAIMFTDIVGFTAATARRSRADQAEWLGRHDRILAPIFRAFGGKVIKTIGDAYLVTFESPTDAVLCGTAIQDALALHNRQIEEAEAIRVRVVVNLGEVRVERKDVFGEPVNVAARIEGIAESGEVVFTEAVYLAMNKSEVPSVQHGEHQLKGITEPVRLYRVPPHSSARLVAHDPPGDPAAPAGLAQSCPYGGRALGRLDEAGVRLPFLDGIEGLGRVVSTVSEGLSEVTDRFTRVRAQRLSPRARRVAIAGAALLGVALLVQALRLIGLWPAPGLDDVVASVDAEAFQRAEQQIAALREEHGAEAGVTLAAAAYLSSGKGSEDRALDEYERALEADPAVGANLAIVIDLVAYLDGKRDKAMKLLKRCDDGAVRAALNHTVRDDEQRFALRLAAATLAIEREVHEVAPIRRLALRVLEESKEAKYRCPAIGLLAEVGTEADVAALESAREGRQDPLTGALNLLKGACDQRASARKAVEQIRAR